MPDIFIIIAIAILFTVGFLAFLADGVKDVVIICALALLVLSVWFVVAANTPWEYNEFNGNASTVKLANGGEATVVSYNDNQFSLLSCKLPDGPCIVKTYKNKCYSGVFFIITLDKSRSPIEVKPLDAESNTSVIGADIKRL